MTVQRDYGLGVMEVSRLTEVLKAVKCQPDPSVVSSETRVTQSSRVCFVSQTLGGREREHWGSQRAGNSRESMSRQS